MTIKELDKGRALRLAIIILAGVLAYHNVLGAGFITDDYDQIVNNQLIRSLDGIPDLFFRGVWQTEHFEGQLYRPLAFVSWLVEYSIVGPKPFLYHLDNVVLHLICSVLVYLLVTSMLKNGRVAFFTAVLFAVHPVHAEAVDWLACRMELLYALFSLSSLILFIAKPRNRLYVAISCLLYLCALLSKESAIVLPLLILIYLLAFENPTFSLGRLKRAAVSVSPYLITTALYIVLRISVIGLPGGTTTLYSNYSRFSGYEMFLVMSRALYEYLRLAFLPFDLREAYLFRPPDSFADPRVILPWTLIALVLLLLFHPRAREKYGVVVFSGLWFFAALIPVSNIIPAGIVMAERALYVPSIAACLILGIAVSRIDQTGDRNGLRAIPMAAVAIASIVASFTLLTLNRNCFWAGFTNKHFVSSMRARTEIFPENPVNHCLLSNAYIDNGDIGANPEKEIMEALRLDPYDPESHFVLARLYTGRKDYDRALDAVLEAMRLDKNNRGKYLNLAGIALRHTGRHDAAEAMFSDALGITPGNPEYMLDLGNLLLESDMDQEALVLFEKAAELDPNLADAYVGMAIVQDARGESDKAVASIRKAVSLSPADPDLHYFLAVCLARAGYPLTATRELEASLSIRPGFADAINLLERLRTSRTETSAGPGMNGK